MTTENTGSTFLIRADFDGAGGLAHGDRKKAQDDKYGKGLMKEYPRCSFFSVISICLQKYEKARCYGLFHRQLHHCQKTNGADYRTRTDDLLITNQLLYQLS